MKKIWQWREKLDCSHSLIFRAHADQFAMMTEWAMMKK